MFAALCALTLSPEIRTGSIFTHSLRFERKTYELSSSSLAKPAVTIRGNNIDVDFKGSTLQGTGPDTPPDQRKGLALLIEGNNITVENANIRGYKLAILARNCKALHLIHCDWSYNWKQHLKSTLEKEDESDWMSFHHNEHDEWINGTKDEPAYGAGGAYLSGCDDFEVNNCKATGGQCGLMLSRSNHGKVWSNDFSYLSAIGVGLYRSSDNKIMHNSIDYCVRGYSHGVYSRGQDSAGILVYEQSNRNIFAYNSATHGGDGFFLWAGQSTMDTGKGGCNDNFVFGNNFSHSPANGIEATFSRNRFVNNKLVECWHGIWGGYSYDSKFIDNQFAFDGQAVAIEHGHNNEISANTMDSCDEGFSLWADPITDKNWAYPRHHNSTSHDYRIVDNVMSRLGGPALSIADTRSLEIHRNRIFVSPVLKLGKNVSEISADNNQVGDQKSVDFQNSKTVETPATSLDRLPHYMTRGGTNILENEPVNFRVNWSPRADGGWGGSFTDESLRRALFLKDIEKKYAPTPVDSLRVDLGRLYSKEGDLGRRYILVDEWGPYDFRRPLLWPRENSGNTQHFEILGPKGTWIVAHYPPGVRLSAEQGQVPGNLDVTFQNGRPAEFNLDLLYKGGAVTDEYGRTVSGDSVSFSYSQFFLPISWDVKWFKWDDTTDPRKDGTWSNLVQQQPIKTASTDQLDYAGSGAMAPGLPQDHYATVAEGTFKVQPGNYNLEVTTDDGARAWIDDKPAITNAWKYQGPTTYTAPLTLSAGTHRIRVEHFQIDGYATLKVEIKKASSR